jgi:uncharacterized protein (TIGR02246 family)
MRFPGALLLTTLVLLEAGCASQPVQPPPPARNLRTEVIAELERAVAAWNTGDLNGFIALYDDDATFSLADSFLQGRAAIREFYAPLFQPGATREALSFDQFDVEVLSLDVVLVRGIYRASQRTETVRRGTTTLILRRVLNHWRIIHDQTC